MMCGHYSPQTGTRGRTAPEFRDQLARRAARGRQGPHRPHRVLGLSPRGRGRLGCLRLRYTPARMAACWQLGREIFPTGLIFSHWEQSESNSQRVKYKGEVASRCGRDSS